MSTVLEVVFETDSGSQVQAVLKLYDRRFGKGLRSGVNVRGDETRIHCPHSADAEARFQSIVREGKIGPFLEQVEHENRTMWLPPRSAHRYAETPDGPAMYEAGLYQDCKEDFECETEAYARLGDIQGDTISQMYAHISLCIAPPDLLDPSMVSYFEIKGILLQQITGFKLIDLPTAPVPQDPDLWQDIIQRAVNATRDINLRGVHLEDSSARNVMVDRETYRPYIIDFAQSVFKKKLVAVRLADRCSKAELSDEEGPMDEEEEFNGDVEFLVELRTFDNTRAVGVSMAMRMEELKGAKMAINYPDWEKLMEEARRTQGKIEESG